MPVFPSVHLDIPHIIRRVLVGSSIKQALVMFLKTRIANTGKLEAGAEVGFRIVRLDSLHTSSDES